MSEIGLLGAFLGGLLALLSPCSALLLPSFFAYAFDGAAELTRRTAVFLVGLLAVLVPLGAGVGAIGSALTRHRDTVTTVAALVLIVLGLIIASDKGFGSAAATARASRTDPASLISVLLLGAVYGLAGFCAGPLLGAVLTVAVAGGSPLYGGIVMGLYAFGMTIPLWLLALVWDRFDLTHRRWLRPKAIHLGPLTTTTTALMSGLLFIGIGLLFLMTEGTASLGSPVGASTMVRWQGAIADAATHVDNLWLILIIAIGVAAFLTVRIVRAYREPRD